MLFWLILLVSVNPTMAMAEKHGTDSQSIDVKFVCEAEGRRVSEIEQIDGQSLASVTAGYHQMSYVMQEGRGWSLVSPFWLSLSKVDHALWCSS